MVAASCGLAPPAAGAAGAGAAAGADGADAGAAGAGAGAAGVAGAEAGTRAGPLGSGRARSRLRCGRRSRSRRRSCRGRSRSGSSGRSGRGSRSRNRRRRGGRRSHGDPGTLQGLDAFRKRGKRQVAGVQGAPCACSRSLEGQARVGGGFQLGHDVAEHLQHACQPIGAEQGQLIGKLTAFRRADVERHIGSRQAHHIQISHVLGKFACKLSRIGAGFDELRHPIEACCGIALAKRRTMLARSPESTPPSMRSATAKVTLPSPNAMVCSSEVSAFRMPPPA